MASIQRYKLKNGSCRYRVWYTTPDNKRKSKCGFKLKADAEHWKATTLVDIANGSYVDADLGKKTISALSNHWLENKRGIVKPKYYYDLETALRVHVIPKWGSCQLGAIKASAVQSWVSGLSQKRSATVVFRAYGCLKGICEMAIMDNLIKANPCSNIQLPKKSHKQRTYLTPEQVMALANASGKYKTLILVLGFCGLRWGEASALRVEDIDVINNRINIHRNYVRFGKTHSEGTPKTWENRSVPVPLYVMGELKKEIQGKTSNRLVFEEWEGEHLREQSRKDKGWYSRAIVAASVPSLTIHDLRHTAASIAVSAGANVKCVQKMLGHKNASMTLDTYADLFDTDLDNVAMRINNVIEGLNVQ